MARYVAIELILSLVAIPTGVAGQSPSDGNGDGDVAGIEIIRDLPYARYGDRILLLDLFRPTESSADPRPAIVLIRGGSWRRTDKENFGRGGVELARRGLIAVSIAIFPRRYFRERSMTSRLRYGGFVRRRNHMA